MTRRLSQVAVIAVVLAGAFRGQPRGLRVVEVRVAGVALLVLAVGLVMRPGLYGLRRERRDERGRRRDWPWE